MKTMKTVFFMVLMLLMMLGSLLPQEQKQIYHTKHINPHPPELNGFSDDPCWDKVEWESGFIQSQPYENSAPSQPTRFKIMYDEKNVYAFIRAFDNEPGKIERRVSRRDQTDGDTVYLMLDSYFDKRTAFVFKVSAAGCKADGIITNNGNSEDYSWDPIWDVKTGIDKEGWSAELAIPLSQLRFASGENLVWGLQVGRNLFRKNETSIWQFISRKAPGLVHLFGELHGFQNLRSTRHKQLLPYTVGKLQYAPAQPGNPFQNDHTQALTAGLDGKLGVTSDLTLDLTVNPDFGQVEADPSVVNLTGYETYFAEKRPFFIEGKNILNFTITPGDGDFSMDTPFYSRRIGRAPQGQPATGTGEYLNMPLNTSILGAFKLTGKTKSGLSIGIMEGLTAREHADIGFFGPERRETVEPLTNYFAMRLQQDFRGGASQVGAIVTSLHRDLRNTNLDFLHKQAYSGGIDFSHTWKNRSYYISGNILFSHVQGTPEAILRTQLSPAHLFQRPDADHVEVDPDRTSLQGYGGTLSLGKNGNGLLFATGVTWRSPGLEMNDMGYLRNADMAMQWIWANYPIIKPFSIFRRVSFNFNQWSGWNFSGTQIFAGGNIGVNATFKNNWGIGLSLNRQQAALSQSILRGGPSLRIPGGWNYSIGLNSDNRKKVTVSLGAGLFQGENQSRESWSASLNARYQPSRNFSFSIQPSYSENQNHLQYVAAREWNGEKRYLMALIEQKSLAMTIRFDLCLTPELSIQFYGQPFISQGKYSAFKAVTTPRADLWTDRFHIFTGDEIGLDDGQAEYSIDENGDGQTDYRFPKPDFNILEFRSNLVLRWEFRPNSILYLVWSQGRGANRIDQELNFGSTFGELIHLPSTHIFLAKFTYSFNF